MPVGTELTATTGIAARQIEGKTIHSLLHFFNRPTFEAAVKGRRLDTILAEIPQLVIDGISMFQAYQLDAVIAAASRVNCQVTITGDFCQLPPVPEKDPRTGRNLPVKFAFEGAAWPNLEVELMTGSFRQVDPHFQRVLNELRRGQADPKHFAFHNEIDNHFDGVTIFGLN
jgi:hypothetical protein